VRNKKSQKGATLIGMLIGIMVLSIALTAQLRLLSVTVKREADLRSSIIATNLAREGVEMGVLWRNTNEWNSLVNIIGEDYCPDIDNPKATCGADETLEFGSTDFFVYNSSSVIDTRKFARAVSIQECDLLPVGDCLLISSTVSWDGGDDVILTKKIFNWYNPNE